MILLTRNGQHAVSRCCSAPLSTPIGSRRRRGVLATVAEIGLQGSDFKNAGGVCLDALHGGNRAGERGVIRHLVQKRCAPQRPAVGERLGPFGGVEDQDDIAVLDSIDDVGPAFKHLVDFRRLDAVFGEVALGAAGQS